MTKREWKVRYRARRRQRRFMKWYWAHMAGGFLSQMLTEEALGGDPA